MSNTSGRFWMIIGILENILLWHKLSLTIKLSWAHNFLAKVGTSLSCNCILCLPTYINIMNIVGYSRVSVSEQALHKMSTINYSIVSMNGAGKFNAQKMQTFSFGLLSCTPQQCCSSWPDIFSFTKKSSLWALSLSLLFAHLECNPKVVHKI